MPESIVGICVAPRVAQTKNGESYVAFDLGVKAKRTQVRIWSSDSMPEAGQVVELTRPTLGEYMGVDQYTALGWVTSDSPLHLYVEPVTTLDARATLRNLETELSWATDDGCLKTAIAALKSFDENDLLVAPAAKTYHHARPGGLLEHIWSLFILAGRVSTYYHDIYGIHLDYGVLRAAIVLHDLGKLVEMSGPYASEYTTEGRLIGHIVIGAELVDRFAPPELSEERKRNLKHCILSHHGKLEWGSPVVPQTPEAILLHQIDMLDSRMDPVLSRAAAGEKGWVSMGYGKSAYLGGE